MQRHHLSLTEVQGLTSLPGRPGQVIMAFKEKLSFFWSTPFKKSEEVWPSSPIEVTVEAKQPSGWNRSPESEGKGLQSSSGSGK